MWGGTGERDSERESEGVGPEKPVETGGGEEVRIRSGGRAGKKTERKK